jgi:predicted alpha/beta superfamily hydrolase
MDKAYISNVVIPNTWKRIVISRNREYHIFISVPMQSPPPTGFPVIYVLDANSVFGTMTEAIRAQSRFPERTGVDPAIVVGIGYDTDAPFHPSRHYDFTFPVPQSELPVIEGVQSWPEQGGSAVFLGFIEGELKPIIEHDFPVDTNRQTLFGHSLGGLFVMTALFSKPYLFQKYVAGSPSIYWNERNLLEKESGFEALLTENKSIELLLTIGELENQGESLDNNRTEAMATRLSSLKDKQLSVKFKEFQDESHISVLPVLISQGIRFATRANGFGVL